MGLRTLRPGEVMGFVFDVSCNLWIGYTDECVDSQKAWFVLALLYSNVKRRDWCPEGIRGDVGREVDTKVLDYLT